MFHLTSLTFLLVLVLCLARDYVRKRENLVNTLTRKFIDEMKEYQNAQQAYKVNIRNKAVQQIKFVKEDATPEEVEEIMKSEGGREGYYQQAMLQGGVNENIK